MNARDLVYIAVCTALISVTAWIAVPIGEIPITLQTAAVCLTAGLLGWKRGLLAVTAYLLLGAVGVPVFAGFTGGIGKLLSPTGGYIVGFLPLAFSVGLTADIVKKGERKQAWAWLALSAFLGLLVCYAVGTVWFVATAAQNSVSVGFWAALGLCVVPYFPFELVKIPLSVYLMGKLSKFVKTE